MMRTLLVLLVVTLFNLPLMGAPKGVVLVISDGTSLDLLTAARIYKGGVTSRLEVESLPQSAMVSTYSFDGMVTDSGASATAMARGYKTNNAAVGLPPEGKPQAPSLLELARKAGWVTGVVSDDTITGATPAAFFASVQNRAEHFTIANQITQLLGPTCDILLGGGQFYFTGDGPVDDEKQLPIFRDTQEKLKKSNIQFFDSWEKWQATAPKDLTKPVLGVFAPDKFTYLAMGERRPHLEDLVAAALDLLQKTGKPYFLVVEASLPDKACHANLAKVALEEVLALDRTVGLLRKSIGTDVLLLVTTDHNNGGLTINPGLPVHVKGDAFLKASPITKLPVLTFSSGPGGVLGKDGAPPTEDANWTLPETVSPALIKTGSAYHTGGHVWLVGEGPGSEKVRGFLDNTDIYKIAAAAIAGK